ncbi:transcription activator [Fulvivirga imtechensis AK7]|uniref:Transcription activator n=2 Tax=Fulvivirga TaxID=396811 RepID=L8JU85_9BACT|nr:transcription activator [Fulvivirga imtechensis AK7]
MEVAKPFEVNTSAQPYHVLVATQGSTYKDTVVQLIIEKLRENPVYIKVVDVSALPDLTEEGWAAMVILHTWEYSKPQPNARAFVDDVRSKEKLIVLSTSGEGTYTLKEVDGISSASQLSDASEKAEEITKRIKQLLTKNKSIMETKVKYDVKKISWPEKTFVTKRETVAFDSLSNFFTKNYDAIYENLQKAGIQPSDPPCAIYYKIDEEKKETELAAAVPVQGKVPDIKGFGKLTIPPSTVITTTYYGPYDDGMRPAYAAMEEYLNENKLTRELMIEEYLSDPMIEKDTSKWQTNIYFIVK